MKKITSQQLESLDALTVVLNQEDKLVEETNIEGAFEVVLKPLTRTANTKLQLKYADDKGIINTSDWQKAMFLEQVVSWTGLFVNEYEQNIDATDDFKEKVYEYPLFKEESDLIMSKLLEVNGMKAKKEESIKKNVPEA